MTGVRRHTVCWLIRHGQTAWNREQRYQSRTDLPLTPFGLRQAEAIGHRLRRVPLTAILHSSLRQAEQTAARIVRTREKMAAVEADERWREASYGHWEGLRYREVMARFPDEAERRFADPWLAAPAEGETLAALHTRIGDAWRELLRRHDGERVAIVGQALPIQFVLCALLGIDRQSYWRVRIDLGSISCVDLYPAAAIVRNVNLVPPLLQLAQHEPTGQPDSAGRRA